MAYFPSGTEGADYQERYCHRCIHFPRFPLAAACPVWEAHERHNGEDGEVGDILDLLIPRAADGLGNEQCSMFLEEM